ncbi:MAG: hypothetical protein FWG69_03625 [Oscillospiraceae bacterium]|nr:hypothetical protein [Oscillospiraceae bacterium]
MKNIASMEKGGKERKTLKLPVDFHTHVLPGMDDGAKNTDVSRKMLHLSNQCGIMKVAATPHYYACVESVENFIIRRKVSENALAEHMEAFGETGLIGIIPGAEVRLEKELSGKDLSPLCLKGTNLLLLELPYRSYSPWMSEEIWNIISSCGVVPVLAHIDRYLGFYKKSDFSEIFSISDFIYQTDTDAFRKKASLKFTFGLAEKGFRIVVGSDCHDTKYRPPNFDEADRLLQKNKSNRELFRYIQDCSDGLL